MEFDGTDTSKKIAFEFVSYEDIWSWKDNKMSSSDYLVFFKETAQKLNEKLKEADTEYVVAMFYDPQSENDKTKAVYEKYKTDNMYTHENMRNACNELAEIYREDLRAQVSDFIAWLKAESII